MNIYSFRDLIFSYLHEIILHLYPYNYTCFKIYKSGNCIEKEKPIVLEFKALYKCPHK